MKKKKFVKIVKNENIKGKSFVNAVKKQRPKRRR